MLAVTTIGCIRGSTPPPPSAIYKSLDQKECNLPAGHRRLATLTDIGAKSTALLAFERAGLQNFECDEEQCVSQLLNSVRNDTLEICDEAEELLTQEFAHQPILEGQVCAAVAIGPKHLLTSRHCCDRANCKNMHAIFDYFAPSRGPIQPGKSYPAVGIAKVTHLPERDDETDEANKRDDLVNGPPPTFMACSDLLCVSDRKPDNDHGLVLLETKDCHGRPFVECAVPQPGDEDRVVSFGFPDSVPMVRSGPGQLVTVDDDAITISLRHNDGNSGGPILRAGAQAELLGVAYAGGDAYRTCTKSPFGGTCTDAIQCVETDCDRAYATKMNEQVCRLASELKAYCGDSDD